MKEKMMATASFAQFQEAVYAKVRNCCLMGRCCQSAALRYKSNQHPSMQQPQLLCSACCLACLCKHPSSCHPSAAAALL
jgi:hypothetical protein